MVTLVAGLVGFENFQKVGLTIGKAVTVVPNLKAAIPAYLLELDFGKALSQEHKSMCKKEKYTSSAQLCSQHTSEEISGQFLMCVYNFPRKQIGPKMSDCLVTGMQKKLSTPEQKRETTVFMRPSCEVPLGSKIGLWGEEGVYHTNPRNLGWDEFANLDLRIGTIVSSTLQVQEMESGEVASSASDDPIAKHIQVDLGGDGITEAVGFLRPELANKELNGLQVMVLTNLNPVEILDSSGDSTATAVICTVAGRALLQPGKSVENGYKLA